MEELDDDVSVSSIREVNVTRIASITTKFFPVSFKLSLV